MKNPESKELISIGMPAYNGEKNIKQAISSLLNQTYTHFELIISDDASNDKTETLCENYLSKDKRIKYIRQRKNLGFANNFNYVLNQAKGKYFVWAAQDDYWDKSFLEKLANLLKKNKDAVLAVSRFANVGASTLIRHKKLAFLNSSSRLDTLLYFIKTGELSFFYGLHRTEVLKKIGGYQIDSRPFFKSSDYLTILRVLLRGKMVKTDDVLFFKRDTGYHFRRFEILKNLTFDKKILKVILRYACFPIFFAFNLVYSIFYTLKSEFNTIEKIKLIFYISFAFIRRNLEYVSSILVGFIYLIKGSGKKLFNL